MLDSTAAGQLGSREMLGLRGSGAILRSWGIGIVDLDDALACSGIGAGTGNCAVPTQPSGLNCHSDPPARAPVLLPATFDATAPSVSLAIVPHTYQIATCVSSSARRSNALHTAHRNQRGLNSSPASVAAPALFIPPPEGRDARRRAEPESATWAGKRMYGPERSQKSMEASGPRKQAKMPQAGFRLCLARWVLPRPRRRTAPRNVTRKLI